MRTLFLIAFLSLSGAALSAPTTALVLPIDGPGLLPNVRNDLESAVRARLAAEPDGKKPRFALTSPDDVAAVLQDAGGAGLACSLDDAPCLVRIGVIAGVDEVWVGRAQRTATALQLRLIRVDVARRRALVVAAGVVVAGDDSVGRVVARALAPPATVDVSGPASASLSVAGVVIGALPLPAPLALEVGPVELQAFDGARVVAGASVVVVAGHQPASLTSTAPPPTTSTTTTTTELTAPSEQPPDPTAPSPLLIAGGATLGVGALVAVVCAIGAGAVELGLGTPQAGPDDKQTVADQRALGVSLVAGAAVGTAVAVTGAVLLGLGMP